MAAENNGRQVHPDIESNSVSQEELIKIHSKHMRRLAFVTVIVLLLSAVVLAFALIIMRIRSPDFRIRSVQVENLVTKSDDASLGLRLNAEILVKNSNFGRFQFEESSVEFDYGGHFVGEISVGEGKVGARSAKKTIETVELEIEASSKLENDVKLGFLTMKSKGKLSGTVYLLKVLKTEKTVEMKCTIVINLADKVVHDLKCD